MKNWQGQEGLSSDCKLAPIVVLAISGVEHPCDRCMVDRAECQGFPRKDSGRVNYASTASSAFTAAPTKAAREARVANTVNRCPVCHRRKRGSNHDQGAHHQKALKDQAFQRQPK